MITKHSETLSEGYSFDELRKVDEDVSWGMLTLPEGYEEECMYVKGMGYYWCE